MANDPIVINGPDIFSSVTSETSGTTDIDTAVIGTNAVTDAKFRQSAALVLVGNPTIETENVTDIPIGPGLEFINGTLNVIGFSYIITPEFSGEQDNWSPSGIGTATTIRFSSSSYSTITGITSGIEGRILILENNGAMPTKLASNNSNSSGTNQFGFNRNVFLSPNDAVEMIYDGTNNLWRLSTKEKDTDSEYYGSGKDGDLVLSGGTIALTRDMYYQNLTLNGGTIYTNGWKIFVSEMLDISSATSQSIMFATGPALNGLVTETIATSFGTFTAILWPQGNTVGGGGVGAPAGTAGHRTSGGNGGTGGNTNGLSMYPYPIYRFADGLFLEIQGGSGGAQNSNGLSGAGGGVIYLSARFINRGSNINQSIIQTQGGSGANGGGGGWIYLAYGTLLGSTISDALNANGGVGSGSGMGGGGGRITLMDLTKDSAQETIGSPASGVSNGTCLMNL
jgi:hypothetical protein